MYIQIPPDFSSQQPGLKVTHTSVLQSNASTNLCTTEMSVYTSETRWELEPKCVSRLFLGIRRSATVFPRIMAGGGDYFFFRFKRGQLFEGRRLLEGGDYFKYCSLKVMPPIILFYYPINSKNNHVK